MAQINILQTAIGSLTLPASGRVGLFNDSADNIWKAVFNVSGSPVVSPLINLSYFAGTTADVGTAAALGSSGLVARGDHVHRLTFATLQTVLAGATGAVAVNSQLISSVANPVNPQDAATKAYVDAVAAGIIVKAPVQAATTGALPACTYSNGASGVGATLTENANGALVIDSYTVVAGDRVLIKDQASGLQNGIYSVTATGSAGTPFVLTRTVDADQPAELAGTYCFVESGTVNTASGYVLPLQAGAITIGTTALNFVQFTGLGEVVAGAGLTKSGNTLNVGANVDGSIIVNADDVQVGILATDAQHGNRGGGGIHSLVVAAGAAGFMSGSDKSKLDGIASGATAYTDEQAQDAVAAALTSTNSIRVTYDDPGNTIKLDESQPPVTSTGASKSYATTDRGAFYQRSNSGSAMTDTLPTLTNTAADIGWYLAVSNLGTTVTETITFSYAGGGTPFPGGSSTYVLQYGCRQTFIWTGTAWVFGAGNSNLLRRQATPVVSGNFPKYADITGNVVLDSGLNAASFDAAGAAAAAQAAAIAASQPLDSDLTAIAALTTTSFGRSLLTLANAGALAAFVGSIAYNAVTDFGFVGDLYTTNGTSSLTGNVLTDSTNPFTAGDVGKRITVPRAGAGSGVNAAQLTTTIASFTNSGTVVLTATATNNVASVSVSYGTDNSTAQATMVSTINGLSWPGARIVFPRSATNRYGFTGPVVFNKACQLEGIGGGYNADSGEYARVGGTALVWWATSSDGGTPFGGFITFSPTGVQSLKRVALRHIWLDCRNNDQNQAFFGLKLASCQGFVVEDFFVMDPLAIGVWLCIATSPTEAKDCTRFSMRDIAFRCLDNTPSLATTVTTTSAVTLTSTGQSLTVGANTLPTTGYVWIMTSEGRPVPVNYTGGGGTTTLTGCTVMTEISGVHNPTTVSGSNVAQASPGVASAMVLDGGTAANTCCCLIEMIQISYGSTWGPAAMEFWNCDSVLVIQPMMNGGSDTNDGAINRQRRPGVRQNGSNVNATLAARNNHFISGDPGGTIAGPLPGGGLSCMGVLNTGTGMLAQSGPTIWDHMQLGNGCPVPTREGKSTLEWSGNGMLNPGYSVVAATVTSSLTTQTISATSAIVARAAIVIPPQGFLIGTTLRCQFTVAKSAAGITARTLFAMRLGNAGTTADSVIAQSTSLTPTAAADIAQVTVTLVVTAATTSTMSCEVSVTWARCLTTTGFATVIGPAYTNTLVGQGWAPGQVLTFGLTAGTGETFTVSESVGWEVIKGASP